HIALTLEALLLAEPHVTLYYFCSSHHTNSALSPFIWELERAAGFERSDFPATKWSKLEAWLTKYGSPAEHCIALLSNLLSLPPDVRYPLPAMSPQKQKDATLSALLAQLQQMAATQPVLIIFEDVHWIDPTSLELLALIVERLVDFRILLLAAARMCHVDILWAEETLPLAAAQQMRAGHVLYRDIWFDKPPFAPMLYTALGGEAGWRLRLAGALYAWLC